MQSLIDLAVQSTTGVKSGFSETLESQIVKILQATAAGLKQVSLADRKKSEKDKNLSEEAFLEAHPEHRAVVVINNFLHKSDDSGLVYEKITDFTAALVQSNIAHVIFLTDDTSYSKSLSKSLPDRVFHQLALGDLSPHIAKKFVLSNLDAEEVPVENHNEDEDDDEKESAQKKRINLEQRHQATIELDECIETLGGRLTDLQVLARRLKIGQTPKKAVAEIVDQSASEILRMFLLPNKTGGEDRKWSTEQAWWLVKEIAGKESLRYNEVLLANTFATSTTTSSAILALEALSNAELITITSHNGRPQTIRAGKPVYQAAFRRLLKDVVLKAKMDLDVLSELAKIETKTIDKAESELALLGSLPTQPYQLTDRVDYLLKKLQTSQTKVQAYENQMAALKRVLAEEA